MMDLNLSSDILDVDRCITVIFSDDKIKNICKFLKKKIWLFCTNMYYVYSRSVHESKIVQFNIIKTLNVYWASALELMANWLDRLFVLHIVTLFTFMRLKSDSAWANKHRMIEIVSKFSKIPPHIIVQNHSLLRLK